MFPFSTIFIDSQSESFKVNTSLSAFFYQVEIITSRGYPVEVHTVTTDDGYILEVHRIPHGKGQSADSSVPYGKPVFLQHGFSTSDADWLISPSDRSLGKVNFIAHTYILYTGTAAIKGNLLIQTFYYYFLQHFAWQI